MIGPKAHAIEYDVVSDQSLAQAFTTIKQEYGKLDGILHAIAYALKEELMGKVTNTTRAVFAVTLDVSAYSFLAVAKKDAELELLATSASLVTLTYMGTRAIPHYNAISAGAIKTLEVTGIKERAKLLALSKERTVDQKEVTTKEVGGACTFLMSALASGVTAKCLYVDKGVHLI